MLSGLGGWSGLWHPVGPCDAELRRCGGAWVAFGYLAIWLFALGPRCLCALAGIFRQAVVIMDVVATTLQTKKTSMYNIYNIYTRYIMYSM